MNKARSWNRTILIGAFAVVSFINTSPVSANADYQTASQPDSPERGAHAATQVMQAQLDPGAPCEASTTDYSEVWMSWVESPPSVLNECGLGKLINFDLLRGFDPFGSMHKAINGAICGFIKNEIHDPFVDKINSKISQHNRWVNDTNSQYSSWINEQSRKAGQAIYDPRTRFAKQPFPGNLPPPTNGNPNSPPITYPTSPIDNPDPVSIPDTTPSPAIPSDDDILDGGGSVVIGDNDDGTEIIITNPDPSYGFEDDVWDNIDDLYDQN